MFLFLLLGKYSLMVSYIIPKCSDMLFPPKFALCKANGSLSLSFSLQSHQCFSSSLSSSNCSCLLISVDTVHADKHPKYLHWSLLHLAKLPEKLTLIFEAILTMLLKIYCQKFHLLSLKPTLLSSWNLSS